jgi:hypothetical protein
MPSAIKKQESISIENPLLRGEVLCKEDKNEI